MRQLGTGKSTLPGIRKLKVYCNLLFFSIIIFEHKLEMKAPAIDDSRLKKLREVLVISLDRIVDQVSFFYAFKKILFSKTN